MRTGSLRTRVTSWYVAFLAAALVFFGAALYFSLARYLDTSLQRSLQNQATSIAERFLPDVASKGETWLAGEVNESYAPETSARFIRITQQGGRELFRSGDVRDPLIDASEVPKLSTNQPPASFRAVRIDRAHTIVLYTLPFTSHGIPYLVEVGASRAPIDRLLRGLLIALLVFTPVTLAAAALGGRLLMSQPLKPLVSLTQQAERIGTTPFIDRLPVIASGDELERLSLSLNRMIARLEDALDHNRRFSADVSHELRTPLTILRGELEELIERPGLAASTADVIGSALEEIERMAKIVESLLAISRLDAGGAIVRTPIDLRALTLATTEQMRLVADEKHILLTCADGAPVVVEGDPIRLSQIIVNLVDNAIKYTPAGGHVFVKVLASEQSAILQVGDTGSGIPAESLPHVFERFYRADKARSRASGGVGLGLSIVKAICTAHSAELSIKSEEGEGTIVHVEFPLSTRESTADETTSRPGSSRAEFRKATKDREDETLDVASQRP
jgi:heavy metal sensor kinase